MTPRFHTLTITDVRRECDDAVSLAFRVPPELADDYRFAAGQHLTLRAEVDGEELRRSYSICAAPDDGELRVAIRRVPGGLFSTWAESSLATGDTIDVMTPDGRFGIAPDPMHARHYAAFAAGSGITPILSLVRTLLSREPGSRFTLVYGNRGVASTMFLEALEDLKDRHLGRFVLITLFSRETQDVDLFNGRLDGDKVRVLADTLLPVDDIDAAFVCGPGGMIDSVASALTALGLPGDRLHVERFGEPVDASAARPVEEIRASAQVVVVLDGVRREVPFAADDASILDAAVRQGLDLPFSCKGGMCCTCRCRVLEGEVTMRKNYSLDAADVAAGFVLGCQARPVGGRVVVSYDDR
jgi:ring-1,2-phenylacetyl-CoA epoxidase subunit PaaE